ncbi:membrane protein insertion efficiency factor YidD [Chlamydia buteonis]|uniref:Putative membrane protein insertion efficiency factor n=1 Tax=Chlamydia buteonis TaxID=2494525 RepID=A0ABX8L8U9_9CHLA|nr:membrane protein insertion efficiency factor YidD [Chlamydia buteonis]QXE27415.1 membrane protein insertion efficiency factor YidD [Chlamydia buteonis]QXE27692.1 membrane protein insertion efficiency factor YidD [Chlamydia buteonis]
MSFKQLIQNLPTHLCCSLIHLYRWTISPLLGSPCRFFPTCSQYALQALKHHKCIKGLWLIIKRIGKCGPWHPGGIDLVPMTTLEEALDVSQVTNDDDLGDSHA